MRNDNETKSQQAAKPTAPDNLGSTTQHASPHRLLRLADLVGRKATEKRGAVPGLLPVSASFIWKAVKAGTFPAPLSLGPNTTAWKASEVLAWIASRSPDAETQAA